MDGVGRELRLFDLGVDGVAVHRGLGLGAVGELAGVGECHSGIAANVAGFRCRHRQGRTLGGTGGGGHRLAEVEITGEKARRIGVGEVGGNDLRTALPQAQGLCVYAEQCIRFVEHGLLPL